MSMSKVCRILLVSAVMLFGSCLISRSLCGHKAAPRSGSISKLQKKVILSLEKIEERVLGGAKKENGL
jgi:hypothetical protein